MEIYYIDEIYFWTALTMVNLSKSITQLRFIQKERNKNNEECDREKGYYCRKDCTKIIYLICKPSYSP